MISPVPKLRVESVQSDAKWEQGGSSTGHFFFFFLIFSAEDSWEKGFYFNRSFKAPN